MSLDIQAVYEEDIHDARTYMGEEAFVASQARRVHLSPFVEAGGLHTADDHYHATFIYQHGDRLEHWAMAHLLARTALDLGHPRAAYMVAASHDRWLMRQGRPQKYGTNSIYDGQQNRIWDYDPATTDAERAALGVPPLAELIDRSTRLPPPSSDPSPLADLDIEGHQLQLIEIKSLLPGRDFPVYGFPSYHPLRPNDLIPTRLPDGVTLHRFGRLCVALTVDGTPVVTWHRCRWAIKDPHPPTVSPISGEGWGEGLIWLSDEHAHWQRVLHFDTPTHAWLVGGTLVRATLEAIAVSL